MSIGHREARVELVVSTFLAVTGAGVGLVLVNDVLRTVLVPRARPTLSTRAILRAVGGVGLTLADHLPRLPRQRVLDLLGGGALLVVLGYWVTAATSAAVLVLLAVTPPSPPSSVLRTLAAPAADQPLTAQIVSGLLRLVLIILVMIFAVHLVQVLGAYSRRERTVNAFATRASTAVDAEALLAAMLRRDDRTRLELMLAEWLVWMTDVEATHRAYPVLVLLRPSSRMCWLTAATVVLDMAALLTAIAPRRAAAGAVPLLEAGVSCLPSLAHGIADVRPLPRRSHEWREESDFGDVRTSLIAAGLEGERSGDDALAAFHAWRTCYAPHAVAIAHHLLFDDVVGLDGLSWTRRLEDP